ncbi:OsmC family protein [Sediminitomix flava]|uniref:Putative redox protein n=1 Tax=Sediminitomix flava TaxID=379075 RepID=A0A315Z9V2_SEDFL|nr:OsmC family protein [Sediminitomix flava]PWJ42311.1 putative redox protein [Sediminitomix flava]
MEVTVDLNRLNEGIHFEGVSAEGHKVEIDGKPGSELGAGNGMSPMQLVLAAVGGCSVFDVVGILKKQRQDVKDIKVSVTGDRDPNTAPSPYKSIHIAFKIYGEVDLKKAQKACELGVDKYCSVGEMLKSSVEITHSVEVLPA